MTVEATSPSARATRIAAWSGPRNISTAMLRSWGARADTFVSDEPLYAHYLRVTGLDHPGRDEIVAAYESDWETVVEHLTGPVPGGKAVWYQKHMTHHMIPEVGRGWVPRVSNCFLIREPGAVILSYSKVRPEFTAEEIGYPQEAELFDLVRRETGRVPPVVDALDVLENPRRVLGLLCEALGVPFDPAMLAWEPGPRDTDGLWAPYWYANVERSTGFAPPRPRTEPVPERYEALYAACLEHYERLSSHRLH